MSEQQRMKRTVGADEGECVRTGLSYTNNWLYLCCQELDFNYVKVHHSLILKAFVHSVITNPQNSDADLCLFQYSKSK